MPARPPRRPARRKRSPVLEVVSLFVMLLACAVLGYAVWQRWGTELLGDRTLDVPEAIRAPVQRILEQVEPQLIRNVYLNREGALLTAGIDDARKNISSIVSNSEHGSVLVPAFAGTPRRWDAIVKCVREKFAPFNINIVDRRPMDEDYVMALFGGSPKALGVHHGSEPDHVHQNNKATGLAPYNAKPVRHAVVLIFSRSTREKLRATCDTAVMEIAHAYGLDHARNCKDAMTYMRPCGKKRFLDRDIPCGEHKDRTCGHGDVTQNSYKRLMKLLGPRPI